MPGFASLSRRTRLWAGFAAVLLPLLILLVLQYVWLHRLERLSAIAERAVLGNYLETIGADVEYYYRSLAERALNIPASTFKEKRLDRAAAFWSKKPVTGARRLFLVDYTRERFGNYLLYDDARGTLLTPPASDEALAIIVACTPWQVLSYRGTAAPTPALRVDERNPDYRIVLNPITDETSHLVGVAGMILDEERFRKEILPDALRKALPDFMPDAYGDRLTVTVRDGLGGVVLGTPDEPGRGKGVTMRVPFVFNDWTLGIRSPGSTPEEWARASFAFNISLSALLGTALLGGIALALRAAGRLARLSEMKSDFVSNVSHELRTPLASIRVFAELLRLGKFEAPEKVREYGEFIEAESRRLSRLIDNILDFSRIESGRKTYRLEPADLAEVAEATIRSFEVHLSPRGIRIDFRGPEPPLPAVTIDRDAIAQALHNLLDNAVKYSGGSRDVAVRLARDGEEAVLEVEDHGIGIPREEQRRIFERFHRVSSSLVHEVKGSGLGLSIVRHIAEVHGGRVTVASEPGRGSTFSIRLPLARTEAA